jgi:AcrR family transcriptional regulator
MVKNIDKEKIIIEAARSRFAHYGFNKTTMAEIAADCRMSAANIYRYFPGKKSLLAQIAKDFFTEVERDIRQQTADPHLSPIEKIKKLVQITLNNSYEHYSATYRINEAIDFICTERVDLIVDHRQQKMALLEAILKEGVEGQFFKSHDTRLRAESLVNATVLVHPVFLGQYKIDYLRETLNRIVEMMTEGLLVV